MPEKYALQKQAHVRLIKLANAAAVIRRTRRQVKQASGDAQPNWLSKSKDFMRDNPGYSAAIGAGIAGLLGTMTNGVSGGLVGAGLGGLAGWGGSNYLQQSTTGDTKLQTPTTGDTEPPESEYTLAGPGRLSLIAGQGSLDSSDVLNGTDLSDISSVANHLSPPLPPGTITVDPNDFPYLGNSNPLFTVPQEQPLGVTLAFAPGSVAMAGEGPNPYSNRGQVPTVLDSPFVNSPANIQVPDTINYYHTN